MKSVFCSALVIAVTAQLACGGWGESAPYGNPLADRVDGVQGQLIAATSVTVQATGDTMTGGLTVPTLSSTGAATFATSGGNVGIGIAAPTAPIHVNATTPLIRYSSNSVFRGMMGIDSGAYIGGTDQDFAILAGSGKKVRINANANSDADRGLTVAADYNVGIGISSPSGRLHVYGGNIVMGGNAWFAMPVYRRDGNLAGATNVFFRFIYEEAAGIESNGLMFVYSTDSLGDTTPEAASTNAIWLP